MRVSTAANPGEPFELAFRVTGEWINKLGQARNGDYGLGRAVELNAKDLVRVKNAPQQHTR